MNADKIRLSFDETDKPEITLSLTCSRHLALKWYDGLRQILLKNVDKTAKSVELCVDIKEYREKRSKDSNSYCWTLICKIADVLRTTKEDVYIEMLKNYGQREREILRIREDAFKMFCRATNNHCCIVGMEYPENDARYFFMAILRGSSTYNTQEMSVFIDGIVSEAKELDIETLTPDKIALLKGNT